jgi:hypothetical protein
LVSVSSLFLRFSVSQNTICEAFLYSLTLLSLLPL